MNGERIMKITDYTTTDRIPTGIFLGEDKVPAGTFH